MAYWSLFDHPALTSNENLKESNIRNPFSVSAASASSSLSQQGKESADLIRFLPKGTILYRCSQETIPPFSHFICITERGYFYSPIWHFGKNIFCSSISTDCKRSNWMLWGGKLSEWTTIWLAGLALVVTKMYFGDETWHETMHH